MPGASGEPLKSRSNNQRQPNLGKGEQCALAEGEDNRERNVLPPLSEDDLDIGEQLTKEQKAYVLVLLNNYRNCFATTLQEMWILESS